jgi:uncharacterized protein YlxW (UPF0749 family)
MENIKKYLIFIILGISLLFNIYLLNKAKDKEIIYDFSESKKLHELYRFKQDSIILEHKKEIRRLNSNILGLEKKIKSVYENKNNDNKTIHDATAIQLDSLWKVSGY